MSELFGEFGLVHGIVKGYLMEKGERASRKYFAENAQAAYGSSDE